MKSNPLLMSFILVIIVVFKALFIGGPLFEITSHLLPVNFDNDVSSDCGGGLFSLDDTASCIGALAIAIAKFVIAVLAIMINVILVIGIFVAIQFQPIPHTPPVIDLILTTMFLLASLITIIGFIPGED